MSLSEKASQFDPEPRNARMRGRLMAFPVRPRPRQGGVSLWDFAIWRSAKRKCQQQRAEMADRIYAISEVAA